MFGHTCEDFWRPLPGSWEEAVEPYPEPRTGAVQMTPAEASQSVEAETHALYDDRQRPLRNNML